MAPFVAAARKFSREQSAQNLASVFKTKKDNPLPNYTTGMHNPGERRMSPHDMSYYSPLPSLARTFHFPSSRMSSMDDPDVILEESETSDTPNTPVSKEPSDTPNTPVSKDMPVTELTNVSVPQNCGPPATGKIKPLSSTNVSPVHYGTMSLTAPPSGSQHSAGLSPVPSPGLYNDDTTPLLSTNSRQPSPISPSTTVTLLSPVSSAAETPSPSADLLVPQALWLNNPNSPCNSPVHTPTHPNRPFKFPGQFTQSSSPRVSLFPDSLPRTPSPHTIPDQSREELIHITCL